MFNILIACILISFTSILIGIIISQQGFNKRAAILLVAVITLLASISGNIYLLIGWWL